MEESEKEDNPMDEKNKIYIIGGRGVGKTSFLNRLLFDKYDDNIIESELGITASQYKINDKEFTIKELTDDEDFTFANKLKNELEDILLIFVIFSLDNRETFKEAKNLVKFIYDNISNNTEISVVILGNKYDLDDKKVHKREVKKITNSNDNIKYFQISCKNNHNMNDVKEIIENLEIKEETKEEDNELTEEERKKKFEDAKCCVFC